MEAVGVGRGTHRRFFHLYLKFTSRISNNYLKKNTEIHRSRPCAGPVPQSKRSRTAARTSSFASLRLEKHFLCIHTARAGNFDFIVVAVGEKKKKRKRRTRRRRNEKNEKKEKQTEGLHGGFAFRAW